MTESDLFPIVVLALLICAPLSFLLGFIEGRARGRLDVWNGEWP